MKNERKFTIETEREADGRWLAEIIELPGVMVYGSTSEQAQARVEALAFRVLADELEKEEGAKQSISNIVFSVL